MWEVNKQFKYKIKFKLSSILLVTPRIEKKMHTRYGVVSTYQRIVDVFKINWTQWLPILNTTKALMEPWSLRKALTYAENIGDGEKLI